MVSGYCQHSTFKAIYSEIRKKRKNLKILSKTSPYLHLYLSALRMSLRVLRWGLVCSIEIRAWISLLFFQRPVAFCSIFGFLKNLTLLKGNSTFVLGFLFILNAVKEHRVCTDFQSKWYEKAQSRYRFPVFPGLPRFFVDNF